MQRAIIGLVAGLAVVGVLASPSAHAQSHFSFYFGVSPVVVAPPVYVQPAPFVVAPPVVYGYNYWQPGYYTWGGYQRHWVPGRYVRGPVAGWHRGWDRGDRWGHGRWNGARVVRGGAWRR